MDPLTIGAVGAVGNIASSALNMFSQNRTNRKMIKHQWDMWNATNEYNTPSAQMQRFLDAGLNPNLIYGQGSSGEASQAGTPSLQAPQMDIGDPVGQFLGGIQAKQTQQMNDANIEYLQAKTNTENRKELLDTLDAQAKILSNKYASSTLKDRISKERSQLQKLDQDITLDKVRDERAERLAQKTIEDVNSKVALRELQGDEIGSRTVLNMLHAESARTSGYLLGSKTDPNTFQAVFAKALNKMLGLDKLSSVEQNMQAIYRQKQRFKGVTTDFDKKMQRIHKHKKNVKHGY